MVISNEVYEQEIEKIVPRLEELENKSFDEIIHGLYHEILYSPITRSLIFALTYVLDPSKFYIGVDYWAGWGEYVVKFAVDIPQYPWGPNIYREIKADESERPTDKEARDLIKKYIGDRDKGGLEVEGIIKKAKEVIDTCKVIRRKNGEIE